MSRTVDDAAGLELKPFRGVRYVQDAVDLAAVTSPPYDLIGPGEASRLEAQEPHNLVRLTLPDPNAQEEARYARAGRLLREWLRTGVLRRDDVPALYVYEERGAGHVQRGLIGALGLRAPEDGVILPHEDVHPAPVADRMAQMTATDAHLEPIYLLVPGTGAAAQVVAATAATSPLLTAHATWNDQRVDYRLWAVTDPDELATVASALRDRQALIADGHHRYAAYRELQRRHHDAGDGPGPWDHGLAFVVDSAAYPPTLRPIHRVVPHLKPAELLANLPASATVTDAGPSLDAALSALAGPRLATDEAGGTAGRATGRAGDAGSASSVGTGRLGETPGRLGETGGTRAGGTGETSETGGLCGTGGIDGTGAGGDHEASGDITGTDRVAGAGEDSAATAGTHSFVVAGDGRFHLVTLPRLPIPAQGATHSAPWYRLDVSVLHERLLGDILHVPDDQVRFVHTAADAVAAAEASGGTALLVNPPTEADVHTVAAAGDRMPRKSTSFGPKPRNGLVFRLLTP